MPTLTPDGAVDQMGTFQRKHSSSMSAEALRQRQNAQLIEAYKQGPVIKVGVYSDFMETNCFRSEKKPIAPFRCSKSQPQLRHQEAVRQRVSIQGNRAMSALKVGGCKFLGN
jgi:hypothetical protein